MDWSFYTKKVLSALILPPASPLLLILVGLVLIGRRPRWGRALAWTGTGLLLVLSLPVVAALLMSCAIDVKTFDAAAAHEARAIVVLGGGRRWAPEYGGETVSEATLDRIRYGAKLSQELDLPILVTGGSAFGDGIPVARLMAQALDSSFQVPARWVEDRSRDTHENALLSAQQLRAAGIDTIVLVTHDYHQRRSIAEFEAVGLRVIPAPVTFAPPQRSRNLPEHLPSASALKTSSLALHEIIGYWVLAPKRS